jgi:hypothetical protein
MGLGWRLMRGGLNSGGAQLLPALLSSAGGGGGGGALGGGPLPALPALAAKLRLLLSWTW